MTKRLIMLGLATFSSILYSSFAIAQNKLTDNKEPIHIQASTMTLDDAQKVSVFSGSVKMTQGTIQILADKVEVSQDPNGITTAKAWGNPVSFEGRSAKTNKQVRGWANQVEYREKDESIILIGNARVISEGDEIRAQTIRYFRSTGEYRADGASSGKPVFVTIQPRNK